MMDFLINTQLEYSHFIRPIIVGTLVSIVCSVVGCFIILRGMAFLADAIAHSMLAGVVAGYLLIKIVFQQEAHLGAMLLGAILAGIVTVAMVGFVTQFSRIKQDTAIGIMYTGIFALSAFVVSLKMFSKYIHIDIYHYIIGDLLSVPNEEMWLLAIVSAIVLGSVILFFRQLQLTTFDPIMAASIGIPVLAVEYLLTACTSLVVVSGVQIAGVILVVALIITPAATAYLFSDRLDRMIGVAVIFSVIGFWLGFYLAYVTGGTPGAAVVVTMSALFGLSLIFAPRYGLLADWVRRSSAIPQEIMEDVLGSVLRAKGEKVKIGEIERTVTSPNMRIRKAIKMLTRQDLLELDGEQVSLTDDGRLEAIRLVRAHRLWETYLEQTGVPETEIHRKAHKLEHISDQKIVDYLDDKLGHPLADPHGTEIPAEKLRDREVPFSVMRNGSRGIVKQVLANASGVAAITVGTEVIAGERTPDEKSWTLVLDDGTQLDLNHDQADALIVRVVSE